MRIYSLVALIFAGLTACTPAGPGDGPSQSPVRALGGPPRSQSPIATPTPSPTSAVFDSPVATPSPTNAIFDSPVATPTEAPTPTATNTPIPTPTATATNTPAPTATRTPIPTATPTATPTPIPTATATATAIAPDVEPGATYTIRRGDTLWWIAGRAYGDPWLWQLIYATNSQLTDPDLIHAGNGLFIPSR
ncbi:MAG: LysM peptidoglycan-binding domain-containing protein [Anaerolineae bacterium]